jgi:Mg2+ and Co2+ transporter CorA
VNDIVVSGISALAMGIILKYIDYSAGKSSREDQQVEDRIMAYHDSLQREVERLTDENHKLREESDRYRTLYLEQIEKNYRHTRQEDIDR